MKGESYRRNAHGTEVPCEIETPAEVELAAAEAAAIGANTFEAVEDAGEQNPTLTEWLSRASNEYTNVQYAVAFLRFDDTELERKVRDAGPEAFMELCESCKNLLDRYRAGAETKEAFIARTVIVLGRIAAEEDGEGVI